MKNGKAILRFGVICGIVFALYTVLGRLAWRIDGYISVMSLTSTFYINSKSNLNGAIWGTLWAFLDGFILGVLWVWLYSQFPHPKNKNR